MACQVLRKSIIYLVGLSAVISLSGCTELGDLVVVKFQIREGKISLSASKKSLELEKVYTTSEPSKSGFSKSKDYERGYELQIAPRDTIRVTIRFDGSSIADFPRFRPNENERSLKLTLNNLVIGNKNLNPSFDLELK